jgi:hypothetical protein
MQHSTVSPASLAMPLSAGCQAPEVLACWQQIDTLVEQFAGQSPTPQTTQEFEEQLASELQEIGRVITEGVLNRLEHQDNAPAQVQLGSERYRRRRQHPNIIGTTFGRIVLWRYLYEPLERGEHSIHLLEIRLGIEAGIATPALAERVGRWTADRTERAVLEMLQREHRVQWSKETLRKLTASLSAGMASHRHEAQVAKVLTWLKEAEKSRGRRRPVLSVGRDGIHTPIRGSGYHEGTVATVSVYSRRGKRLGTVYLAAMAESGQGTLSQQLTRLIHDVLAGWEGPLPRLAYVTDDGYHPRQYYRQVLRRMENPRRPGTVLAWERVVDHYHACQYISQLAEALFGAAAAGQRWAKKMRHWLKQRTNGIVRVLRSAAALASQRRISNRAAEQYFQAYRYLRNRRQWMHYATYQRQGMPIGSGVTEAACKIVFTQRLKQSGMSWSRAGGQLVLDLRVILLSQVWKQVHASYLVSKKLPHTPASTSTATKTLQKAA